MPVNTVEINGTNGGLDGINVETGHAPSLPTQQPTQPTQQSREQITHEITQPTLQEKMKSISDKKGSLSVVIGNLKSAITKYCRNSKMEFGWQERFHDHIIRDREEYYRITEYIKNNPSKWVEDKFYTT
jgi:hypothetical protein